jgi:hypothetical protein
MSETVTVLSPLVYGDMVGRPFRRGGRGPYTYDCWGVLQAILRRLGNHPTDFPTEPALMASALEDEWVEIKREMVLPGDGVLMRSFDPEYVWHIGVAVDPWRMLHVRESVGVCVEAFDSTLYKRRIVGFYRFKGRA